MNQVVTKLKDIITKTNLTTEIDQIELNLQLSNERQSNLKNIDIYHTSNNSLHGELSQTIKHFHNMNTNEIEPTILSSQAAVTSYKINEKQSKLYINYYHLIILKLKKVVRSLANYCYFYYYNKADREILSKEDLSILVDETVAFIFNEVNEGKVFTLDKKPIL